MHEYTGRNVNLIGGNFNEILWFLDYSGDKPIPQHYLMPRKDGAGVKEAFQDHEEKLSCYRDSMEEQLHDLISLLDQNLPAKGLARKRRRYDKWRQQATSTISDVETHLSLLQNYKRNLQYDVLLGDNDCTFLTNIISFVKENKPVYPNMKFTIVVNGATQYQKLINDAFSSENCKNAFANLYNFITKDPRYTVVQDTKQQVLDYLSVTGSPEYADYIEVVDILQILLCDLGPNIIFADQGYAPEDVASTLDRCVFAIKENRRAEDKSLYLSKEEFDKLDIKKQLAINIVHNYMIFYFGSHAFSQDDKAQLFDLVASFLSALRGAVVPNADFYCHNALECYKDENYVSKDDRAICILDARGILLSAKRLINNNMKFTKYFDGGHDAVLTRTYLNEVTENCIASGIVHEHQIEMYVGSVFSLFLQSSPFPKKKEMRKEMLAVRCDALNQEKFSHSSPVVLFENAFSTQKVFKLPVYSDIYVGFIYPMHEELCERDKRHAFFTYYCHSRYCRIWEQFFQESRASLNPAIRDEFEICFNDMQKVSNFIDVVYSYNRFLTKRGFVFPLCPAETLLGGSTSQDQFVAALNLASDIQVLFLTEMMSKEIDNFFSLLSVLTLIEMVQEKMNALKENRQGPDPGEFFSRLANRIIAAYAFDPRYKADGDNQKLSDIPVLSTMFVYSFVLGNVKKCNMQAPECIADVPFMNALISRGGIAHRLDYGFPDDLSVTDDAIIDSIFYLKKGQNLRVKKLMQDKACLATSLAKDNLEDVFRYYTTLTARYDLLVDKLDGAKPRANMINTFMEMAVELPSQIIHIMSLSETYTIPCMIDRDQYLRRAVGLQKFFIDSTIEEYLSEYPCTKVEELSGVDNIEELKALNMRMIDGALCDDVSLTLRTVSVLKKFASRSGMISLSLEEGQEVAALLTDLSSDCTNDPQKSLWSSWVPRCSMF